MPDEPRRGNGITLGELSRRVDDVEEEVDAVARELGGMRPGGRPPGQTIRERLHKLESEAAAAELVQEILNVQRKKGGERWTRRERIALFLLALWVALLPTINLFLNLRQK